MTWRALISCAFLLAADAAAQTADIPPPPAHLFLDGETLTEIFTDLDLFGCYPDGSPVDERTAADGSLYDLVQSGVLVGDWWVQNNEICYRYTGEHGHPQGVFCWNVVRDSAGALYFFNAEDGAYGGSSICQDLIS